MCLFCLFVVLLVVVFFFGGGEVFGVFLFVCFFFVTVVNVSSCASLLCPGRLRTRRH